MKAVAEKGRANIELPIEFSGKEISLTFDPRNVTDMLLVLNADVSVTLELVDGNSAALLRGQPRIARSWCGDPAPKHA